LWLLYNWVKLYSKRYLIFYHVAITTTAFNNNNNNHINNSNSDYRIIWQVPKSFWTAPHAFWLQKCEFIEFDLDCLSRFLEQQFYHTSGVNFINVLRTAFTLVGPKSVKRYWRLDWVLTLWGTTGIKAVHRTLMKSSPDVC